MSRGVPAVVLEQRPPRAAGALRRGVAEAARQAVEVAALLVEVGDRAVLDDAQAARQAVQEMPAALQRVGILRRQQRRAAQAIELRRDAVDCEQLGVLAAVAQLQELHDALDVEQCRRARS